MSNNKEESENFAMDVKSSEGELLPPEIDFVPHSTGITVYSQKRLKTPRFIPFDVRVQCKHCKSSDVDVDYIIDPSGVTISTNRMKRQKFVPFDMPPPLDSDEKTGSTIRIKSRRKRFTLPFKRLISQSTPTPTAITPPPVSNPDDRQEINEDAITLNEFLQNFPDE